MALQFKLQLVVITDGDEQVAVDDPVVLKTRITSRAEHSPDCRTHRSIGFKAGTHQQLRRAPPAQFPCPD
jgi:hypothetical protein